MYDIKSLKESDKKNTILKSNLRSNCICDRYYFRQLQKCNGIFELKSIHIPTENIIK